LTENAGHEFDGRELMDQVSRHEIGGHDIGEQDIISFVNKLHYNAVCNSF